MAKTLKAPERKSAKPAVIAQRKTPPRKPKTGAAKVKKNGSAKKPVAKAAAPAKKNASRAHIVPRKKSDPGLEKSRSLYKAVLKSLDDGQGDDIIKIDLIGKHPLIDFMVIASGRSSRHVAALGENLRTALNKAGASMVRIEGLPQGDWVLVDGGDVVVHLFRPEVRAFYNLEKMWLADDSIEPNERLMVR